MGKRNRTDAAIPNDGGSRSKRRKAQEQTPDLDASSDRANSDVDEGKSAAEEVAKQGLKIWHAVKEAVGKDGHILSTHFVVLPDKRIYPDYFVLIKRPIALSEIKRRLNQNLYKSLDDVKNEFDLCFDNARQYNAEASQIYYDATEMQTIVAKMHKDMTRHKKSSEKKHKSPSLRKTMKSKLQELVALTDDLGRSVSAEFMELPSKKEWPIYYQQISKPQCFDNIFKRIKKKEYPSMNDFADDVELVFSNCFQFNQENTGIWDDAVALKDRFRLIMADLPAPFTVARYSRGPKIKIKMPVASTSQTAPPPKIILKPAAAVTQTPTGPPPKVVIPAHAPPATPVAKPAVTGQLAPAQPAKVDPSPKATAAKPVQQPVPKASTPQTPVPVKAQATVAVPVVNGKATTTQKPAATATQSVPLAPNAAFSQYSTPAYVPVATPAPILPSAVNRLQATAVTSTKQAPNHQTPPAHQLRSVHVKSIPRGRPFILDHKDGVKSWSICLGREEQSLVVSNIVYNHTDRDENESSGDEEDMDAEDQPKKKRGRGRPPKKPDVVAKVKSTKKKRPKLGELQVKLNGQPVKDAEDIEEGKWTVNVPVGSSTIEVGEKGGLVWKIYAQRVA